MRRLLLLLVFPMLAAADVRLPAVLGDHMVLQADRPIHLWGWAEPDERVQAKFRGQIGSAAADAEGRWSLYLNPETAGGPYTLEIAGTNELKLDDVLVGEVWVGSGQSNMVFLLRNSDDADKEIREANYPEIRLFKVKLETAAAPKSDVEGEWKVCGPETVADFSAVGYFFARHLHQKTGKPFGVIQSAWGGTPAQAWTPRESLDEDPELHGFLEEWAEVERAYPRAKVRYGEQLARWEAQAAADRKAGKTPGRRPAAPRGPGHQHAPAVLYNAMIAPLTPFPVRGFIWYQGENNANQRQGYVYERLFGTMIEDWREAWAMGPLPFLFVQLANYGRVPETSEWPELRESQSKTLGLTNTGMAVSIDIGNPDNIHPTNKQDVGLRLALAARAVAYGEHDLVYSGPVYRQVTAEDGRLRLWFDHIGSGLVLNNGGKGFQVAGADGRFHAAEAEADGSTVVVSSPHVEQPLAARYAWAAAPEVSLFNREGLPASPFRTDSWRE
jgi:sialate O-acetylesterase